ncbi:polysaccharide deacetylase family protein [Bacillaceae bacterium Marseille-Q3522]|nr:polysaccharide deacetylase family protein [Bacillaceae bacterium Marseille-Q3522]
MTSLMKEESKVVYKNTDTLYEEIANKAEQLYLPPVNARIDRVWKAIPGYNGIKVDIEASYKKMQKEGTFSAEKLVYKQIEPEIHLQDLPPTEIYKGNPRKPMVSFIINVAWGNEYLSSILETLKKHRLKASFFLEGRWVKKNPELAKMIVDAGHEVGNHSYTHPNMQTLASNKIREEIVMTNEVIKATTGAEIKWLAPPSGSYRSDVVKIAAEEGLGTIMWTVDTIDWQKPAPEVLLQRVLSKVEKGSLILMHPTVSTANSLNQLIEKLHEKNLQIGTVTDLLSEKRVGNVHEFFETK